MLRILKRIRSLGLTLKQFLLIFTVFFMLFSSIQWSGLKDTEEKLRHQLINNSQMHLERTNKFLDVYHDAVTNIMLIISSQSELLKAGKEKELQEYLVTCAEKSAKTVKAIYVIRNTDGKVFCSQQARYDIFGNEHIARLKTVSPESYEELNWSEPYYSTTSGQTMAFTMPLRNSNSDYLGMIILEMDLEYIYKKLTPGILTSNQTLIIFSRESKVITFDHYSKQLPIKKNAYPPEMEDDFVSDILNNKNSVDEVKRDNTTDIVIKTSDNSLSMMPVIVVNSSVLKESVSDLYINFYTSLVIWFAVILTLSFIVTNFFTRPIKKLAHKMDSVKEVEQLVPIQINRNDEIGRLSKSYNKMLARINSLIVEIKESEIKKKEFELKMLQSQIGPHFLYNTLACIASLAKLQKNNEVRSAIKALTNLLSYSFDKKYEMVTLKEELECLDSYLKIQKMRCGDMFDYFEDVPQDLMNYRVLKLILQPIVENSIFHGLSPKKDRGLIRIKVCNVAQKLRIIVTDNGVGMNREKCINLLKKESETAMHDRLSSIGVKNVHDRIRIHYGDKYGLSIYTKENWGTVVKIDLPLLN